MFKRGEWGKLTEKAVNCQFFIKEEEKTGKNFFRFGDFHNIHRVFHNLLPKKKGWQNAERRRVGGKQSV